MGIKVKSLIICLLVYVFALAISILICSNIVLNQWVTVLIAHIIATVIVYIASSLFKNSSFYDPFWSIAPIPIVIYISFWPDSENLDYEKIFLFFIPVLYWGIRLTYNWARRWEGLYDEDFRYEDLKELKFASFIDFFGIHLYPTLQVNLSLLPLYYGLSVSTNTSSYWLYLASFYTIMAVTLELISDNQLWKFKKNKDNKNKFIKTGLWSYSRHPNYLGEILFWWGLFFMTISIEPDFWYLFVCPLIMNLMFSLITCKMMDNRSLERRDDYTEYLRNTRQLIPWKK